MSYDSELDDGKFRPQRYRVCVDWNAHVAVADALRLRRWDDGAKVAGRVTRPLESWMPLVRSYFG